MAAACRPLVRARRSQPLRDRAGRQRPYPRRTGASTTGRSVSALWSSRREADGPRYSLARGPSSLRIYASIFVADTAGHSTALEWYPAAANARADRAAARIAATLMATNTDSTTTLPG